MNLYTLFFFLTISVLLGSSGVCWGADFQKGVDAYKRGDYATALKEWTPLAKQGDASAQNNLGVMYDNGQGVPQDYQTAVKWYTLAAEQGNAGAQTSLGGMYYEGDGVPQDYQTAVKWYTLAAEQGNADAQHNLGNRYYNGQGVPQDYVRAHMWFNLSATKGAEDTIKWRDLVAKKLTPADLSAAQKLARECVAKNYKGC